MQSCVLSRSGRVRMMNLKDRQIEVGPAASTVCSAEGGGEGGKSQHGEAQCS